MNDVQTMKRRHAVTRACLAGMDHKGDFHVIDFEQSLVTSGFQVAPYPDAATLPARPDLDRTIKSMGEAIARMHDEATRRDQELTSLKVALQKKSADLMRAEARIAPEGFLRSTKDDLDRLGASARTLADEVMAARDALGRTASEQRGGERRGRGGFGSRG